MLARHEILRTNFVLEGEEIWQKVHADISPDLVWETSNLPEEEIEIVLEQALEQAFDLQQEALLRVKVWPLGTDQHLVLFNLHHIIADEWSVEIIRRELADAYPTILEGKAPAIKAPDIQYKDYAAWSKDQQSSVEFAQSAAYWQNQFSAALSRVELPTDFSRPPLQSYGVQVAPFNCRPK